MNSKEIADAKRCALTTADWDTYQVIIRTCLSTGRNAGPKKPAETPNAQTLHQQNRKDFRISPS